MNLFDFNRSTKCNYKSILNCGMFLCSYIIFNLLFANLALAAEDEGAKVFTDVFCKLQNVISGPIGKGVGSIAIVVVAMTWLTGKSSWPVTLTVIIGVAVIFGSDKIVNLIAGGKNEIQCEQKT